MDITELAALGSGCGGLLTGFWLGVRVCGPRLQIIGHAPLLKSIASLQSFRVST